MSMRRFLPFRCRLERFLRRNAFTLLFASLIAIPLANLLPIVDDTDLKIKLIFALVVLVGTNVLRVVGERILRQGATTMGRRLRFWIGGASGVLGVICGAIPANAAAVAAGAFSVIFCAILTVVTFGRVIRNQRTDRETLAAALAGYLQIGLCGFFVFSAIEALSPGSFIVQSAGRPATPNELYYFAFVTILTIGYGDISAVTWPAQNAAILMAIVGYLYGLVFIARVVNDFRMTVPKDETGEASAEASDAARQKVDAARRRWAAARQPGKVVRLRRVRRERE